MLDQIFVLHIILRLDFYLKSLHSYFPHKVKYCQVRSEPPVQRFVWYVNGFEVKSAPNVDIRPSYNECTATFNEPRPGEYRVMALNAVGQTDCLGIVKVVHSKYHTND